jgi:signal transduction histidine kinase
MSTADEVRVLREQVTLLTEKLAQAQKLTYLGELASTTSHEFNNILTTIINYAKMGLRHPDRETREKAFNKILTASTKAAKITGSILGMARRRSGGFEPTDLKQLLEDALLLLEREMNKYHIAVETYFRDVPRAMVNPGQIQQVLLNLLVNARQAMPNGGRVILKLALDETGETVELSVRDTGIGIPADVLPKIFEPFFTTKSGPDATGKGGTGLGLSMCRDIVEAHRGRIRVESSPGKGTAFILKLPLAPAANPNAATAVAPPAGAPAILPPPGDFPLPGQRAAS